MKGSELLGEREYCKINKELKKIAQLGSICKTVYHLMC